MKTTTQPVRPRLVTALSLTAFLRWLATGHVTATVARTAITVPALALAAALAVAAAAAVVAVVAYRLHADRITIAPAPPDREPEGDT